MSIKLFELLLQASIYTVTISVVSILIGFAIAILLSGMLLSGRSLFVRPAQIFISFFRGVPLLVQLLLIYNLLPGIGINVPSIVAAVIGLSTGGCGLGGTGGAGLEAGTGAVFAGATGTGAAAGTVAVLAGATGTGLEAGTGASGAGLGAGGGGALATAAVFVVAVLAAATTDGGACCLASSATGLGGGGLKPAGAA